MPDDNIPSQKYRDTGIPRYFVTALIVKNFWKIQPCKSSAVLSPILFPISVC